MEPFETRLLGRTARSQSSRLTKGVPDEPARRNRERSTSRREFLQQTSGALAGAALASAITVRAYAGEDNTIKIALVGCGGRGTGAAANALSHQGPDQALGHGRRLRRPARRRASSSSRKQFAKQVDVPPERQFVGLDGYKKAIDSLGPGGVVLLATPPAFRPIHLEYAVAKGCNVFMEKSFAVDAPGIRRVLKAGEEAAKKNLKIAGGLMSRHYKPLEEAVEQIHDGAIGEVITCWAYREHGPVGFTPKPPGDERTGPPDPQLQQLHLAQRQLPARLADPQPRRLLLGARTPGRSRPRAKAAARSAPSPTSCSTTTPWNTPSPTARGCSPRAGTWTTAGASSAT